MKKTLAVLFFCSMAAGQTPSSATSQAVSNETPISSVDLSRYVDGLKLAGAAGLPCSSITPYTVDNPPSMDNVMSVLDGQATICQEAAAQNPKHKKNGPSCHLTGFLDSSGDQPIIRFTILNSAGVDRFDAAFTTDSTYKVVLAVATTRWQLIKSEHTDVRDPQISWDLTVTGKEFCSTTPGPYQ